MRLYAKLLIVAILTGTASCVVGPYPDDGYYRSNRYYHDDRYRGYPVDYWNDRPDYYRDRRGDRHDEH